MKTKSLNKGILILLSSLVFYFFIKIPFNLSVLCASENEGFYLVFGQHFLNTFEVLGGILYIPIFSLILKITGFNTWAIIFIHLLHTLLIMLIGTLIFIITKKLTTPTYGGISSAFWVLSVLTPNNISALSNELLSHMSLEAEIPIALFSLLSILLLIKGGTLIPAKLSNLKYYFFCGVVSTLPLMFKANGVTFLLALFSWVILSLILERKTRLKCIFSLIGGVSTGLTIFSLLVYSFRLLKEESFIECIRNYFFVGYYSQNSFFNFVKSLLIQAYAFSNTSSIINSSFFVFIQLLFITNLVYGIKTFNSLKGRILSLLGILGLGNSCTIFATGKYEPYYFYLIWFVFAITIGITLELINTRYSNKLVRNSLLVLISCFFINKFTVTVPSYMSLMETLNQFSIYNQSQSFNDPISTNDKSKRAGLLPIADQINSLVPDKNERVYFLNFHADGITGVSASTYIYSKRFSPTTTLSSNLKHKPLIDRKFKILIRDLKKSPPYLIILSSDLNLKDWQKKAFTSFFKWFSVYLNKNYTLNTTINARVSNTHSEKYLVFIRNKD